MQQTNQDKLNRLIRKLERNVMTLPLARSPSEIVPPEGNPNAELMFIGEAAGLQELKNHRPFVGAAGKLLNEQLEENGIERRNVWITNLVKARPPGNRDPVREEIEAYRPYLDEEIVIIKPKLIVTLGRFSLGKFIPGSYISRIHGQARWVTWEGMRLLIFPMYHPAAALRSNEVMHEFRQDFSKLVTVWETLHRRGKTQEETHEGDQREQGSTEEEKDQQLSLV